LRCGTTTFNRDAHVRVLPPRAESLGELRSGMQRFESCRPSQPVHVSTVVCT
jgi:hypothetical protein